VCPTHIVATVIPFTSSFTALATLEPQLPQQVLILLQYFLERHNRKRPTYFPSSPTIKRQKMYLVNTENFKLEKFDGSRIPLYAILSHTWEEDEITFQEMQLGVADKKPGYKKVNQTCLIAKSHGFDYIWIDTCCIDKTSSAELSEAINSMYHWYQESGICYVYLADVSINATDRLSNSRWFTRGWTLQELIAPSIVIFLDMEWQQIGTKSNLGSIISKVTSVPDNILQGTNPQSASVAERMSWAANRKTTRIEDLAYCLLGIFGVNMPLLYGEGEGAFNRLQEEIIKVSDDHSLFAWKGLASPFNSLLARSPAAFSTCGKIKPLDSDSILSGAITIDNKGIYLKLRILRMEKAKNSYFAVLPCVVHGGLAGRVGIFLTAASGTKNYFMRIRPRDFQLINMTESTLLERTEELLCFQRQRQVSERQLPLERALERGNERLVKYLLGKGADFGFQCDISWKLIFKAIENGHEDIVKLLLEKGADHKSRDDQGRTPLSSAARNGHEAIVKLLLEKGADPKSRDDQGWTPLSLAAMNGHEATVKLLLEKGADLEPTLDYAQGWTPLSLAANNGHEAIVKLLLEKGADLEPRDDQGRTPLSLATVNRYEAIVKLLLEKGADPKSRDDQGWMPLLSAAGNGHEAIVKLLLEKGADPKSRDDQGRTPLSSAARNGHEAIVKLLLEKDADPKSRDDQGWTPLSLATNNRHEAIVKLLLEKGATDFTSKDKYGSTPRPSIVGKGQGAAKKVSEHTR
jgi:ankyrin repeat protein